MLRVVNTKAQKCTLTLIDQSLLKIPDFKQGK